MDPYKYMLDLDLFKSLLINVLYDTRLIYSCQLNKTMLVCTAVICKHISLLFYINFFEKLL